MSVPLKSRPSESSYLIACVLTSDELQLTVIVVIASVVTAVFQSCSHCSHCPLLLLLFGRLLWRGGGGGCAFLTPHLNYPSFPGFIVPISLPDGPFELYLCCDVSTSTTASSINIGCLTCPSAFITLSLSHLHRHSKKSGSQVIIHPITCDQTRTLTNKTTKQQRA